MVLTIAMVTIVAAGLAAIAVAEPRGPELMTWNDDVERRMLNDSRTGAGWW